MRAFNRFYTRRIGALGGGHLGSGFSLTEVRVLYELAHREAPTAGEIAGALGLDKAFMSRMVRAFKARGLLHAAPAADDARRKTLALTAKGRRAFAPLDDGAREEIVRMLQPLGAGQQARLLDAMRVIRETLGDPDAPGDRSQPFVLRQHRPGDMGWVVHRHGVLYAEEYGWDERFEALVAGVVSQFIKSFDPERERCWIAERDGEIVGSIFCVAKNEPRKKNKTTAQLRLLLVEPSARGLGIGARLVDEVIRFARQVGYERLELWTQRNLTSARRIYRAAGFEIEGTEGHEYFGVPLRAESWAMALR